eukprot:NODE_1097_length_1102_cov_226.223172_g844_i0.p2 GENE.NODE_1097_length_1102_cov_226.223172_g844_i0~~NODE_1097_length_1102_cov_226.223172_g844_i0.p2  ORF type:complete len:222 (+),score=41.06 NODE_1097_length_1102_cov_226.223172_g844_i0:62-727(+)
MPPKKQNKSGIPVVKQIPAVPRGYYRGPQAVAGRKPVPLAEYRKAAIRNCRVKHRDQARDKYVLERNRRNQLAAGYVPGENPAVPQYQQPMIEYQPQQIVEVPMLMEAPQQQYYIQEPTYAPQQTSYVPMQEVREIPAAQPVYQQPVAQPVYPPQQYEAYTVPQQYSVAPQQYSVAPTTQYATVAPQQFAAAAPQYAPQQYSVAPQQQYFAQAPTSYAAYA